MGLVADPEPAPSFPIEPDPLPATPPVYGWTVGLHMVELATYTAAQNRRDPIKLVAGLGWPKWLPVGAKEPDNPPIEAFGPPREPNP